LGWTRTGAREEELVDLRRHFYQLESLWLLKKGARDMAKTDKELTAEIVCSYLNAWGTQSNCVPVKHAELPGLIADVYTAIKELDEEA
jgi:hypothetical protein